MHQLISRKNSYVYNNFRKVYKDWKFIRNRFYIKGIMNKKDSDILFIALTISYYLIFNSDSA